MHQDHSARTEHCNPTIELHLNNSVTMSNVASHCDVTAASNSPTCGRWFDARCWSTAGRTCSGSRPAFWGRGSAAGPPCWTAGRPTSWNRTWGFDRLAWRLFRNNGTPERKQKRSATGIFMASAEKRVR